jgi:hypothetical protein
MGLVLRNLLALQELDLQIISLNDEKSKLQDVVEKKKSEADRRQQEVQEQEERIKRLKVEMKKLEVEIAEAGDRIRKLESQQVHVKTNEGYKALDKEIYEAKAHRARTEDILLQKMELLEEGTKGIGGARQEVGALIALLKRESGEAKEKIREIESQVAGFQAKRAEITGSIEEGHLRLYNRIFNNKKVPAIVPVVNRTCRGCHLAVPAAVESILRRHQSNIVTCENCSRILYIPEEEDSG